jgi:hypothetical protein
VDDATMMLLIDTLRGLWEYLLLCASLCAAAAMLALPVFVFLCSLGLLQIYTVRLIRRRFIEGRV